MINEGQTYPEINLEEEIANILAYLRDNGEFSGDAPRLAIIDNDVENARLLNGYTANFNPNNNTITLYTEGRHPSDICKSWLHELAHCKQNQEGRLQNITTDNITEDDNLAELEREAYEFSGMMFRKYKDSKKIKKLQEEYKEYALNELFEKDLPNITKISPTEYIVGNGDDIEARYSFIDVLLEPDSYSFKWSFTTHNSNISPEAWKQVTATSPKILQDFINYKKPKHIYIQGDIKKGNIYKNDKYIEILSNLLNNKYSIEKEKQGITLTSISEVYNRSILKRMETMNETYEQSLYHWENGDLNARSTIERWAAIQDKVKREILQELYNINENYKIEIDLPEIIKEASKIHGKIKPTGTGETYEHLIDTVGEIKLNPENSAIPIGEDEGEFEVGGIQYSYSIYPIENLYNDGEEFYNIYFHPESVPVSEPLSNTSKENYITILNTIYKIILRFARDKKPGYIGISSFDNDLSRNYHAVYNNLSRHNDLPGYKRINSNLGFTTDKGETGRFVVFKRKEENIKEVCHIKDSTDYKGLKQFGYMMGKELGEALQFEKKPYKIFIDLDETLVAFDEGFKTIFGMSTSSYEQKHGRPELSSKIESLDANFWNNLKWLQNGKALWNYIKKYNPTIITAPSSKSSEIGKRKWVNYNLGTSIPVIFAKADKKAEYSGENKILIDDLTSTIYQWIDKGGIGIHFISVGDTINKLKKLGL